MKPSAIKKRDIILGIDIGGTGIKGAPVDCKTGKLADERFRVETPKGATPRAVLGAVREITEHFRWRGRVGCTLPAVVRHGVVCTAANIHKSWIGTQADRLFHQGLRCHTTVVNDADAAGVAEMHFGAGKGRKDLVFIVTLGTGIGTAIFQNRILVPNSELGHLRMGDEEAEHIASNRVREELNLSWSEWAKQVSKYLRYVESLFWPDLFIIGGGVSKKADKFLPKIKTETPLVAAKLLNNAGIVGAAILASGKLTR